MRKEKEEEDAENKKKIIRITIKDTGVGIAPYDIPRLFTKFTCGTGSATLHQNGTGLGLFVRIADLSAMGRVFSKEGIVSFNAWNAVQGVMQTKGFYGVIILFRGHAMRLRVLSEDLLRAVSSLATEAKDGTVERVLEENGRGNIKVPFAVLFSEWLYFEQVFLASSVLSTELYYRHNGYGSLVDAPLVMVA